jgi:peptidoglycan/LPS O-acetylase OafA/YrhL
MLDRPRDGDVPVQPTEVRDAAGPSNSAARRFAFLDALRGLGALAIACYHIHLYRPLEIPADHFLSSAIQVVVRHGWISVRVFWVIAGFVAAYSLRETAMGPRSFGNFTLRRVLRLGIPYWTAILAVAAVDVLSKPLLFRPDQPLIDDPMTWARLAANLGFLQDVLHLENISAGTWFVCVDLQFGLLFALMLWMVQLLSRGLYGSSGRGKTNAPVLLLAFVPLGLAAMFVLNFDSEAYDAWAIYYFHMPLLGAMAYWALEGRIPRVAFWVYAAAMGVGVAMRWHDAISAWLEALRQSPDAALRYRKALELTVALITGVVIYLVGRRGHLGDWLTWRPLQYLGRVSYSLYLTHYLTSWIIVSLGYYWTGNDAKAAVCWMTASVLASVVVAGVVYRYVEAPSLRLAARLRSS